VNVKCQNAIELASELVDDDLIRGLRMRLSLHLLICRHCRRYLESYRTTVRAEKAAYRNTDRDFGEEIPDDQVSTIMNAIRACG
jgi:hypothetical protein